MICSSHSCHLVPFHSKTKPDDRLTFLVKSFPAELAHKRFVSRVDARVRVERGAAVERLPALVALVRFFLEEKRRQEISSVQELQRICRSRYIDLSRSI